MSGGIADVGSVNEFHGVCGFTSSITAMYAQSKGQRGLLINSAPRVTRVLAEIKSYLTILKAAGARGMLREIEQFNMVMYAQLPPEPGKTRPRWTDMDGFIARIDQCVSLLARQSTMTQDNDILNSMDPTFTLYMTPHAVADYLDRMWNADAQVDEQPVGLPYRCIIGVTRPGPKNAYKNLTHWMYKVGTAYWSWGQLFASVADANPNYTVVYTISVAVRPAT
jgi:hypothetical protein